MYYVNRQQIERHLKYFPFIIQAAERLRGEFDPNDPLHVLAQERVIHVAIESVTDIGSYLIDGFLMRDASSYEDIMEIMRDEKVIRTELFKPLTELVKLRKALVQDYDALNSLEFSLIIKELPGMMEEFSESVERYLQQELI